MSMLSRLMEALVRQPSRVQQAADENTAARRKLIETLEKEDVLAALTHRQKTREQRDVGRAEFPERFKNGKGR